MKRALMIALAVIMVPVFLGVYCPCAHASAPVSGPTLSKVPCHGCCKEISALPRQMSDLNQKVFSVLDPEKFPNVLKALNPDLFQEIAVNRRAHAPAVGGPLVLFPEQSLYLSLQVFRI